MTTPEPDSPAESTTTSEDRDTADDGLGTPQRQSRGYRLDRYNKVTALVLTGVASVFVAVLVFGAGVVVGAEFGGQHGHHREGETSDRGHGDYGGPDDVEGRGFDDRADDGSEDVSEQPDQHGSQDNRDEEESSPTSQAPASSIPATPRP